MFSFEKYMNFYHEYRQPLNPFFMATSSQMRLLMISAPSRMGNHLLHSMLDSHSMLPRIPGEDANLFHYFKFATLSIHEFFDEIHPDRMVDTLQRYASTGGTIKKWQEFKYCFDTGKVPDVWSGIQFPTDSPYITDYQNVVFDVNLKAYLEKLESIAATPPTSCADLVTRYYSALNYLDSSFDETKKYAFDGICFASGMRAMALWMLEYFENSQLITTVRDFDSYVISHIRSRYKSSELRDEWIREAWEHWFHKIVDNLMLKQKFKDRVLILRFEDIIDNEDMTSETICSFLGIENECVLKEQTAFGNVVKGNSSKPVSDSLMGKKFGGRDLLSHDHPAFPTDYKELRDYIFQHCN